MSTATHTEGPGNPPGHRERGQGSAPPHAHGPAPRLSRAQTASSTVTWKGSEEVSSTRVQLYVFRAAHSQR